LAADGQELASLARFQQANPSARLYLEAGRVARVFGTTLETGGSPQEAADRFVVNHAEMLGSPAEDLLSATPLLDSGNTLPLMYQRETDSYKFTLVYYSQYRDGLPVFRSGLRLLVRNEPGYPLVWAGSEVRRLGAYRPDLSRGSVVDPTRVAPDMINFTALETVIWAGVDDMAAAPVVAKSFIADNYGPPAPAKPQKRLYVVDAATGEVLYEENLIILTDVTGSVHGMATTIPKSDNCNPEVDTAMKYAKVAIGTTTAYADASGNFTIPNSGTSAVTVTSYVAGQYFTVDNSAGTEETLTQLGVIPPGPANFMHNQANISEPIRAQTNAYVQANVVRDWVLIYNPSYPTISTQTNFSLYVNRTDGYCPGNAWYDGSSLNFCSSSGSYPNTAYSSVVHHEYGHHIVQCGGSGQDQYGEGVGDSVGVCIADDPILGYGFTGNCNTGIRTADNTMQYPCTSDIHTCAQLLSGCVWSTRNQLIVTNPGTYLSILSNLMLNSVPMHTGGSITPQITIDWLTLDDTDGNLDNGTPHWSEICTGFGAHNMDCPALNPIAFEYPSGRPATAPPNQPIVFLVNVVALGGTPVPGTGQLHYALDGGAFTAVAMTQGSANHYQATLPAVGCNHRYSWYVSAQASGAGTFNDPSNAPTSTYRTVIATATVTPFQDNFETNQGWTVGDTGDNATTGIWERADPEPTAAQPGDDHTPPPGTLCYVTGPLAGSGVGSYDVDNGKTTLKSPTLNLAGVSEPMISYWRWYSNDEGAAPNADTFVVDISNNNGTTWVNVETVGPTGPETSGGWFYHEFRVADFVTPTALIKMRFIAQDQGSGSIIEAALDDFVVAAYECQETPVCGTVRGDMNGNGVVNGDDIQGFVSAMVGQYDPCADFNTNWQMDMADVDGMVNALLGL
jgi:hypothetical protein